MSGWPTPYNWGVGYNSSAPSFLGTSFLLGRTQQLSSTEANSLCSSFTVKGVVLFLVRKKYLIRFKIYFQRAGLATDLRQIIENLKRNPSRKLISSNHQPKDNKKRLAGHFLWKGYIRIWWVRVILVTPLSPPRREKNTCSGATIRVQ